MGNNEGIKMVMGVVVEMKIIIAERMVYRACFFNTNNDFITTRKHKG